MNYDGSTLWALHLYTFINYTVLLLVAGVIIGVGVGVGVIIDFCVSLLIS